MKPITVLLAEDHMVVREGLRALLKAEGDIEVVGEAETGRQAVELAFKLCPAVVGMDIAMPQLNGLEATRQIRVPGPQLNGSYIHFKDGYTMRLAHEGTILQGFGIISLGQSANDATAERIEFSVE